MWMFKNPQDYSVLVAENMFGDIVSDLCAGLVVVSVSRQAQTSATNTPYSNRPTVGTEICGQYKVNPIAMLLTAKLMFDWLKETEMATRLESRSRASSRKAKCARMIWAARIPRST